jgi:hypothetical protein
MIPMTTGTFIGDANKNWNSSKIIKMAMKEIKLHCLTLPI